MSDKYEGLRRAAEKATPGPWEIRSAVPYGDGQVIFRGRFEENETIARWNHHYKGTRENIAYIAAASPEVILSLLQERDRESPEDSWRRGYMLGVKEGLGHPMSESLIEKMVPPYSAPKGEA